MEELNPFDSNEITEEVKEETLPQEQSAPETVQEPVVAEPVVAEPVEKAPESFVPPFMPAYNPINYTPVKAEDTKPMSRGLKFFVLVLVAIIALSSACTAGYFVGRSSNGKQNLFADVTVGLDAKPQDTDEMTAAQVYKQVNPSIVGICVYNSQGIGSNATGVIYSEDGYVITNDHIYSEVGAAKFKIYTYDNKEYDAEFVAGDKVSDLAVLKIKDGKFKKATLGNSEELIFGENVVAIGRPGGSGNASSITKGIISATSRRVQTTSNYSSRLIETDSPINPGSSGGALVNMYGQVIGITSSKLASADIDAVGYAIPTTTVKRIVEELIKNGKVLSRAKLGVSYTAVDSITASITNQKSVGLYISEISEDSDLYGKMHEGNIITHINGIKVTKDEVVLDIIEASKAGDKITVTYVDNNGNSNTIEAVLKPNISESSYTEKETMPSTKPEASNPQQGGGAFDFPFGE